MLLDGEPIDAADLRYELDASHIGALAVNQTVSEAFNKALAASIAAGVVHVAAAGNEQETVKYVPGNNPEEITVSALADYDGKAGGLGSPTCGNYGLDDRLASFSNFGSIVDVAAPGVCIYSTWAGGGYETISGTSMASPHVAGAAAILASLDKPESKADVEAIRDTIVEAGNLNWTDTSGDGVKEPLLDVGDDGVFGIPEPAEPKAVTEAASAEASGATLNGVVNPEGTATSSYQFEYGTTTSYGTKVPLSAKFIGSGTSDVKVSETIGGLEGSTTYHFRVVAINALATIKGEDKTFTTKEIEWAIQDPGSGAYKPELTDVSCATESECIAVGNADHTWPIGERWDGTKWSTTAGLSEEEPLTDVSCGSSASCLALPASGLNAVRWNGSAWSPAAASTPAEATSPVLRSISCTSSSFCIAVGRYLLGKTRTLAERWNGSAWTILTTPFEEGGLNELNAVSCTSSISCTAIGRKGGKAIALGWNGSEWSVLAAPKEASSASADISCTAANACTAVIGGTAKVERWNGTEWASATVPTPGDGDTPRLFAVSCASASVCTAVGDYTRGLGQGTLAESWNGSAWSVQGTPDVEAQTAGFYSISCNPSNRCTAVGFRRYDESDGFMETLAERHRTSPTATTEAATAGTTTEATLNATVNPEGYETTYQFEYGTTTSYGTKVPASAKSIGSGTSNVKVSRVIGGLEFGKTYHFRVVATNAAGTTYGADKSYPSQLEWYVNGVKVGTSEAKGTTVQISGELTSWWYPFKWGPCQVEGTGKIWNAQKNAVGKVTSLNISAPYCPQVRYDTTGDGGQALPGCETDGIHASFPQDWPMTTAANSVQLEAVGFTTLFKGCKSYGLGYEQVAWSGSLLGEWTEGETWSNPKGESFNGCIQYNNSGSLKMSAGSGGGSVLTTGPLCMKKAGGGELTLK